MDPICINISELHMLPNWVSLKVSEKLPGHWKIMYWEYHPKYKCQVFCIEPPYRKLYYSIKDINTFYQLAHA